MTKIMLVEDDKSLREIYGVRLLAEGYDITSAGDGEEALAMAVKEKPDLILSDVMMPKISGFDMLDILRSTPETKDIKVIMMTALSSEDQRARGEKLGADRYLVKSQVGIEDVVRTVHDLLADTPVAAQTTNNFGVPQPTAAVTSEPEPAPAQSTEPLPTPEPVVETPEAAEPTTAPEPTQPTEPTADIQPQAEPVAETVVDTPETETPIVTTPAEPDFVRSPEYNPAPEIPQPAFSPSENIVPEPPEAVAPIPAPTVTNIPSTPEPAPVTPVTPAPIAPPTELPQPTAPFSTAAPASLGDRVINPINPTSPPVDISMMMEKELNDGTSVPPVQTPPQV